MSAGMDGVGSQMSTKETASEHLYTYSSIANGTIRLIELQPSDKLEAPIYCLIIEKTLKECEYEIVDHYTALSYVWGDATTSRRVAIGEKYLNITRSLDCALRHIRDRSQILFIWADGICINQADVEDRNIQVRQMGAIYATAHHTLIFLGPAESKATMLMEFLALHHPTELHSVVYGEHAKSPPAELSQEWKSDSGWRNPVVTLGELLNRYILSLPWFSRIWILQELVLSTDPWVQCGETRMRWKSFSDHVECINAAFQNESTKRILSMMRIKQNHAVIAGQPFSSEEATMHFLNNLTKRRGLGVSNPKDMIYGHLGICNERLRAEVTIDYSKSVAEIYQEVASIIIRDTFRGNLSILYHVEELRPDGRQLKIPSWIPDWIASYSVGQRRLKLQLTDDPKDKISNINLFGNSSTFVVDGFCLGVIKLILSPSEEWQQRMINRQSNEVGDVLDWLNDPKQRKIKEQISSLFLSICESLDNIKPFCNYSKLTSESDHLPELKELITNIFSGSTILKSTCEHTSYCCVLTLAHLFSNMLFCLQSCLPPHIPTAILNSCYIIKIPKLAREGDQICKIHGYSEHFVFQRETGISAKNVRQTVESAFHQGMADLRTYSTDELVWQHEGRRIEIVKYVTYHFPWYDRRPILADLWAEQHK